MYVDMHCGTCEGQLMLDADDNNPGVWMLVHRFANAHSVCGYVTPAASPETEPLKTMTLGANRPRRVVKKPYRKVEEEDE